MSSIPSPAATGVTRLVTLTRLNQLAADEGANGMVFDSASRAAYVVTYSGADSISRISPDGDQIVSRYLLPNRPEFGSLISGVAIAGSTMVLDRSLLETLAFLDLRSGTTVRQISARELGVAHLGPLVAGAAGHVFVLATLPLPTTAPFIPESVVLELDASGAVLRRLSVPRPSLAAYPAGASGLAFDPRSGALFFGGLSDAVGVGLISVVDRDATAARAFIRPPEGARILAADPGHILYVGSRTAADGTQVDSYDSSTGALLRSTTFDRSLADCALDEVAGILLTTTAFRDRESDLLLALDVATLKVLAQAEVPWEPYGHGIVLDPTRSRVYVSSRVRPASVTTFGLTVGR